MLEGFEIAVNDAARVRVRQCREHLVDHGPRDGPRQVHRVHPLVHAATGQDIHDEKGAPITELAEIARSNDGGMVEQRYGACFLVKPPALFGGARSPFFRRPKPLERDAIAGDDVLAQVDNSHPATAELSNDLVPLREDRTDFPRCSARPMVLHCRRHAAGLTIA